MNVRKPNDNMLSSGRLNIFSENRGDISVLFPDVVLYNICKYLDSESVISLITTCKRFLNLPEVFGKFIVVTSAMLKVAQRNMSIRNVLRGAGNAVLHFSSTEDIKDLTSFCPNLEYAKISSTEVDAELLSNVRYLNLKKCNVKNVSSLTRVEKLNLDRASVQNFSLPNIRELNICYTSVTDFSSFSNLEVLVLRYTPVKNEDLVHLKNIKNLDISRTKVSDVSVLTNVENLDVSWTWVTDVSKLTNLCKLDISCNYISDISSLRKLKSLSLCNSDVEDVSECKELEELDVSFTKIRVIPELKKLKMLYFRDFDTRWDRDKIIINEREKQKIIPYQKKPENMFSLKLNL